MELYYCKYIKLNFNSTKTWVCIHVVVRRHDVLETIGMRGSEGFPVGLPSGVGRQQKSERFYFHR